MRQIIPVVLLLLLAAPAYADERQPVLDALYGCLVGNGAVEINYGATAGDAMAKAETACEKQIAAAAKTKPIGDMGDNVEAVEDAVSAALDRLAG